MVKKNNCSYNQWNRTHMFLFVLLIFKDIITIKKLKVKTNKNKNITSVSKAPGWNHGI
jgi:hypothetical protein